MGDEPGVSGHKKRGEYFGTIARNEPICEKGLVATLSFRADPDLVDEAKGAVVAIEAIDPTFSRERLLRRGLVLALIELRQMHNGGKRFEPVSGKLRTGQRRRA